MIIEGKIEAIIKYYMFHSAVYKNHNLSLSECHVDDDILKTLIDLISKKQIVIETLDLSRNAIRDQGCGYIADLLKTNHNISKINLSYNLYIGRKGFDKIINSIS